MIQQNINGHIWSLSKCRNMSVVEMFDPLTAHELHHCLHSFTRVWEKNVDANINQPIKWKQLNLFPAPCWIAAAKDRGSSEGRSGSNLLPARWPVSFYYNDELTFLASVNVKITDQRLLNIHVNAPDDTSKQTLNRPQGLILTSVLMLQYFRLHLLCIFKLSEKEQKE